MLKQILEEKRREVRERRSAARLAELKARIRDQKPPLGFAAALTSAPRAVIAEIKKASPSGGLLRERFDPAAIARAYAENGARAVSVLTDRVFFQGDPAHLERVRKEIHLPILQKEFVIDSLQVYEARALGADAVLLIAAALERRQHGELALLAAELGLDALHEVHRERELERLPESASLIGINNRDLETLQVDPDTVHRVIRYVPDDRLVVAESGVRSRDDLERLWDAGADAALVGEALMRAEDPGARLKELIG